MKYIIFIVLIGVWVALLLSGYGIKVHNKDVVYEDGSRYTRCYYIKATELVVQDISQAGRIGGGCPSRI